MLKTRETRYFFEKENCHFRFQEITAVAMVTYRTYFVLDKLLFKANVNDNPTLHRTQTEFCIFIVITYIGAYLGHYSAIFKIVCLHFFV